jgi:thymidylate synthase (FAD)
MQVLDKGYVEVLNVYGSEKDIVSAARLSYGKETADEEKNKRLLGVLIRENHGVPFEHVGFQFKIKCPIFVARQIIRYRHASTSEISGRYTKSGCEFYIPSESRSNNTNQQIKLICQKIKNEYEDLLANSVPKEVARMILPLNTYTEFIWSINLRSLLHFLEQRLDKHAQYEIRMYADALDAFLFNHFENVWREFHNKYSSLPKYL